MSEKRELKILTDHPKNQTQSSLVTIQSAKEGKTYWRSLEELAESHKRLTVDVRVFLQRLKELGNDLGAGFDLFGSHDPLPRDPDEGRFCYHHLSARL